MKQIQFVTANYSYLQGLRAIPPGLLLLLVSWWASWRRGPRQDLYWPILFGVGAVLFIWAIDHYYRRAFGQVQCIKDRRVEWLLGVAGGVLGLGAFWVDTSARFPISAVGVLFAIAFLVEYFRRDWPIRARPLTFYPIAPTMAALVMLASLLPLLGKQWWQGIGIAHPMLGVLMIVGLLIIIAGIWGHLFLVYTLRAIQKETSHDQSV